MGTRPSAPFDYNGPYHAFKRAVRSRAARGRSVFIRFEEGDENRSYNRDEKRRRRKRRGNDSRSNRLANRQRRAQSLRDKKAARSFDDQFRQFDRGSKKFRKKATPSVNDLISHVNREHHRSTTKGNKRRELRVNALKLAAIDQEARAAVCEEVELIRKSGQYGHVDKTKPDNTVRVLFENFNSLGVFSTGCARRKKIRRLKKLLKEYDVDLFAGCKTQCDWRFAEDHERFENLFGQGQDRKSVVGFNKTEAKITRRQHGGTAMMALGRLSSQVLDSDSDTTGLGRWCWMRVGGGGKETVVCMCYQPCDPGEDTAGQTSWDQQSRYFEARGDGRSPRDIFFEDLVEQLVAWKEDGLEIILLGDFNKDVYEDRLAKHLAEDDLRMKEQCLAVNGERLPATFNRGTRPLDAAFATAGINCISATIFQKHGGVGDHRCFVLDFHSESVVGDVFPRVVPAAGRKLTEQESHRAAYRKCLNQLCDRHQMFRKLLDIRRDSDQLSDSQWLLRMNKWDRELEQFMRSAENNCRKFKQCHIEWSPEVGSWMRRRWLLAQVRKYLDGKIRDPRNLFRDCRKYNVKDPRFISRDELNAEYYVTNREIERLAKLAPKLRRQHLKDLIRKAKQQGDVDRAATILRILHREASRKRWRRVNRSTKPPRARSVLSVKVPIDDSSASPTNPPTDPPPPAPGAENNIDESPSSRFPLGVIDEEEGVEEFKTKEGVFFACSRNLSERFRLAFTASCYHGQLFDDIGFIGDTECAKQLLEGTYVFPPETDNATRLLFEEVARVYAEMGPDELATYVTVEDYQYYWKRANERISSSYSGLHFGHYKAAAFDDDLSALHAAKLSECAKRGLPLPRWSQGVTVLLEKIMGNTFVHRL